MALDNNDYLVDALEELRMHAKITLQQARQYRKKAIRDTTDPERYLREARLLENQAWKDLEQIQRILANPNLNK